MANPMAPPAHNTHWISSLTKEGAAAELVKHSVPGVKTVHVPMSGCGVSHVYIQLNPGVEKKAPCWSIGVVE